LNEGRKAAYHLRDVACVFVVACLAFIPKPTDIMEQKLRALFNLIWSKG
jgi:hypothetical protein